MRSQSNNSNSKALLKSLDIAATKLKQLKQIFPEVFCEDKIDFDSLKSILGESIETSSERYGLSWAGKSECMRVIQEPSLATLKPNRDESIDFDNTNNVYIEGENLEVLKLLQKSYFGKVKMIYIDPPYNTGRDFVYKDKFGQTLKSYLEFTGQADAEGRKLSTNAETDGRYHSNWLNMMYPRLYLAKNLLREDGVIFISIDDYEVANLRSICDQIFGNENLLSELVWNFNSGTQAGYFTRSHEYILAFAKNIEALPYFKDTTGGMIRHGALKIISSSNPASEITFKKGSIKFQGSDAVFEGVLGTSEKQYITNGKLVFKAGVLAEDVTIKAGWAMKNQLLSWLDGKETFDSKGQKVLDFYFNKNGILYYTKERGTTHLKSVIPFNDGGSTQQGSSTIKEIFGSKVMDFPKPINLIKILVNLVNTEDSIFLDFFSGSATTAHAVMLQNAEDGGNRKYILVQLPEPTPENSEARNAGYSTIAEIGKERIRRAATKINQEYSEHEKLDLGFKVFKLDKSNFNIWDTSSETNLQLQLKLHINPIDPQSTNEDILYELLLKSGYELTAPIQKTIIHGIEIFTIDDGKLLICLEKNLNEEFFDAIAAMKPMKAIFLDSCFEGNDQLKINAAETFKMLSQNQSDETIFITI